MGGDMVGFVGDRLGSTGDMVGFMRDDMVGFMGDMLGSMGDNMVGLIGDDMVGFIGDNMVGVMGDDMVVARTITNTGSVGHSIGTLPEPRTWVRRWKWFPQQTAKGLAERATRESPGLTSGEVYRQEKRKGQPG